MTSSQLNRANAVVAAASGLVSSACCISLAKDANDRLDKVLAEINDSDK